MPHIQAISPLAGLVELATLNLNSCDNIMDISPLSSLTELKNLDLGWCFHVIDISPLSGLAALRTLNLTQCSDVNDLSLCLHAQLFATWSVGAAAPKLLPAYCLHGCWH